MNMVKVSEFINILTYASKLSHPKPKSFCLYSSRHVDPNHRDIKLLLAWILELYPNVKVRPYHGDVFSTEVKLVSATRACLDRF